MTVRNVYLYGGRVEGADEVMGRTSEASTHKVRQGRVGQAEKGGKCKLTGSLAMNHKAITNYQAGRGSYLSYVGARYVAD
jgi:hypothetical protein